MSDSFLSNRIFVGSKERDVLGGVLKYALAKHAGQATGAGLPYYAGVAMAGAHLAWQVAAVDLDSQSDCLAKFGSNKWYGALLFGGIVLDKLAA